MDRRDRPHVNVLWADPNSASREPAWICVPVIEVNERSTGLEDVPWMRVFES